MASGLGKRKRNSHVCDLLEAKECHSAIVHGVVIHVLPVKASHRNASVRYFVGQLTNRKKRMCGVF